MGKEENAEAAVLRKTPIAIAMTKEWVRPTAALDRQSRAFELGRHLQLVGELQALLLRLWLCLCASFRYGGIADVDVLRNQFEIVEGIRDVLLLQHHSVIHGLYTIASARER